jgi:diadenosine tetraphosphatase ApaH/serine/threonine PP2A family protein phosphatase
LTKINAGWARLATLGPRPAVLIALFADIHANRQAFEACLAATRRHGAERYVLLGDYVGYGADPEWTVTTVMDLVEKGALAVRGNHDNAVGDASEELNVEAQVAIEWTRGELGLAARRFLCELPLTREEDDRLYVHADASRPAGWRYVADVADAARSIAATSMPLSFCGHIHRPALYSMSLAGKMIAFTPTSGVAIQLLPGRRWLAVLGSVGQPRDGNPAASYLMLDTARREATWCRAPYDVAAAAARIRERGLPPRLADRLLVGR